MAVMPNGMTTGSGDVQEHDGPPSIDDVLAAEVDAERAIHVILSRLQERTGRRVDWVKVNATTLDVTVNTVSK